MLLTAVHRGLLTLPRVAAITSANAARTFGLYPRKGVIRPEPMPTWPLWICPRPTPSVRRRCTLKPNDPPYDGMSFQGRVVETILRGRTTMRDGQVLPDCFGQFCRSAPNSLFLPLLLFLPLAERLPGARPGAVRLFPHKRDRCMVAPFAVGNHLIGLECLAQSVAGNREFRNVYWEKQQKFFAVFRQLYRNRATPALFR